MFIVTGYAALKLRNHLNRSVKAKIYVFNVNLKKKINKKKREHFIFANSVKRLFATLKIRELGMIRLYHLTAEWFRIHANQISMCLGPHLNEG